MIERFKLQKTSNGFLFIDTDSQMDCNYLKFYENDKKKMEDFISQLNYLVNIEFALNDIGEENLKDKKINDIKNMIVESVFEKCE